MTNPAFVYDRGDRYRATVPGPELGELHRAQSLSAPGIRLAAGSDAPYASCDPWLAMRSSRDRRTAEGSALGIAEALDARAALGFYLSDGLAPGGASRRLEVGAPADLVMCAGTMEDVRDDLTAERVEATAMAGNLTFSGS